MKRLYPPAARRRFAGVLLVLGLWSPGVDAQAQPGSLDETWGATLALDGAVHALAPQPDGKAVIAGAFTTVAGVKVNRIARLNADGTPDATFQVGAGANDVILCLALLPDGRIVAGGRFTLFDGASRNRLVRLQADGHLDSSFDPGRGANQEVAVLRAVGTDALLVGGAFTQYDGISVGYLARLLGDGKLDFSFLGVANGAVQALAIQHDGKLLLGGSFTRVNTADRNRLARLLPDGDLDPAFDPAGGPDNAVTCLALQADGKVVAGGNFTGVNGVALKYLCRLTADGLPDLSFNPGVDGGGVVTAMVQADGKVVIGGSFTSVRGGTRTRLARLLTDGLADPTFDVGTGANNWTGATVLPDGGMLVGGAFTQYNGKDRRYLARVQGVGAALGGELEFDAPVFEAGEGAGKATITVRRSGLAGSRVTVEYAATPGTASLDDFVSVSGRLTIGSNEVSASFDVPIRNDVLPEDDETVQVALANPTGGAVLGSRQTAILRLRNDDAFTSAGGVDVAYAPTFSGTATAFAFQPDGKLLVVGDFNGVNGAGRLRVVRLNPDGSLDARFNPSAWVNKTVNAVALQGDGRILLGGTFGVVNGATRNRLARLNADGTLDRNFDPGTGPNDSVARVLALESGHLIIVGAFTQYGGASATRIARLYEDGGLDPNFYANVNGAITAVLRQPDGRLLIGGGFTTVNDAGRNRIARLHEDGALDGAFNPAAGFDGNVEALALVEDDKILVGGSFSTVNKASLAYLCRLYPEGMPDFGFAPLLNGTVRAIAVQPDGKVVVGGDFGTVNGQPRSRLARLLKDGSSDPVFEVSTGAVAASGSASITAVALERDGRILVGGTFAQFNGMTRQSVARLLGTGTAAGGEIEFATARVSVGESVGSVTVEVRRVGNLALPARVDYATSPGTADQSDYTTAIGTLDFAENQSTRTFPVSIRNDVQVEGDETVNLTLRNPDGGAVLGSQRAAVIEIRDDDQAANPGGIDVTFRAGCSNAVTALAVQPDGKVLIAGEFGAVNAAGRLHLARLTADGSLDATFYGAAWVDTAPAVVVVQPDGRILLGGAFNTVNGVPRKNLARLRADGFLDEAFETGQGPNAGVNALVLLPSGELIIGGAFTQFHNRPAPYIARLYSDGGLDTTFPASASAVVRALTLTSDNRLVLGGDFLSVNGAPRVRVARLHLDGALDGAFHPGAGPDASVWALGASPDGRLVLGGSFTKVNGSSLKYLCRLLPDGTPDLTFAPVLDGVVRTLALPSDGKVIAGGEFGTVNSQPRSRLVRLLPDGALDLAFDIGSGAYHPSGRPNVDELALLPDGSLYVAGLFTQFNGLPQNNLTRLLGVGAAMGGELEFAAPAFRFSENAGVVSIAVKRRGNTVEEVRVDYSTTFEASDNASSGDISIANGTLIFAAGRDESSFPITLRNDTQVEDDETVTLTLKNPCCGAVLGGQGTAKLVILNDDVFGYAGGLDVTFAPSFVGPINALASRSDGRILAVGDFTGVSGLSRYRVVRLTADGVPDPAFNPAAWLNGAGSVVVAQPDGKVLLGGAFTSVNGVTQNYVARLLEDGTLDPNFEAGSGPNGAVQAIALLGGGELVIGGAFTTYAGKAAPYLARLFNDGGLDTSFPASANGAVSALLLQPDGRLVLGGNFTQVNGITRNRVARLNPEGTLDETFDPGSGLDQAALCLGLEADGKLIVGGSFTAVQGATQRYLCRLWPDGTADRTYQPALDGTVRALAVQPDGGVVIGGNFSLVKDAGGRDQSRNRLARLLPDGQLDLAFDIGTGVGITSGGSVVQSVALQADGNVLLGGTFNLFNGLRRNYLARVQGVNAAAGGEIEFGAATFYALEGASQAVINVIRTGSAALPVTVEFATSPGTATSPDYVTPTDRVLEFAAGQSSAAFRVTLKDDALVEDDETVRLTLSNATGGAVLGSQRTSTLVIVNDDSYRSSGRVDVSFAPWLSAQVYAVAALADERLLVVGDFLAVNGVGRVRLARLLPDGSLDESFNPFAWLDAYATQVVLQPDGKILLGGAFTQVNGVKRTRLARLHADGTLDLTFNSETGPNDVVWAIELLSSGEVLVGGNFTQYAGQNVGYLARVFADGSLDPTFPVKPNNHVYCLGTLPDARIVLGGKFTQLNGLTCNRIARLTTDWFLDAAFDPAAGPNNWVSVLALQPDGNLVIGGPFTTVNGQAAPYLARLNSEGKPDPSFLPAVDKEVTALNLQSDGSMLVGGLFTMVGGQSRKGVARVRADGSLDSTFEVGGGANARVNTLVATPRGDAVVGGQFTQFDGLTRYYLVRLLGDVVLDPLRFSGIRDRADGSVLLSFTGRAGQKYVLQRTLDFATWSSLSTNLAPAAQFDQVVPMTPGEPREFFRTISIP